ncbi:MAG: MFS transporter [Actinobacteria bacterium]|nr:MFS transporter [Actinomycetota bacterium]
MTTSTDAGRVAALVGLLFGLAGMGSAAVAVTLPAIAADLGLSTGGASWIISLYALMLAVATAVYGRIADLAGIRAPLVVGVGLMTTGALLGALAPTYEVLLAARLLQGSGAAAVPVLGMAVVSARYDGAVRTTALGRVAGTAAAVSALGPLAGGVVEDLVSWRAVVALPALGLAVASLRPGVDNARSGWWTVFTTPARLTAENYSNLLDNPRMVQSFWNTVTISLPATVLVVVIAALAAYAFAWMKFRGRDVYFLLVVGLLVVPLQVALIPVADLYGRLGLFGRIPGVVLFHVAFGLPFAIFLLRNFFAGIPADLLEAARLDGASEWTIFSRVVLPLGVPAIASLAIFQFLWVWNDLLVGLVFASRDAAPLTVAIREQTRQFGSNIDIIAPGAFLSMVVPLIVFFAFQRFFVQGVLAGSVK